MSIWQSTSLFVPPSPSDGHGFGPLVALSAMAASAATAVRYSDPNTVITEVGNTEFAQSYQTHPRCSRLRSDGLATVSRPSSTTLINPPPKPRTLLARGPYPNDGPR